MSESKARIDLDGFVNFGRIINDDALQALSVRVDAICDSSVAVPPEVVRFHPDWESSGTAHRDAVWQVRDAHKYDDVVKRIPQAAQIRETIELFPEDPARLWSTQVIMKPAFHGSVVPWHQDSSYWGEEKRMICCFAIDDATPSDGCMRMIPGSHRHGQMQFTIREFEGLDVALRETEAISEDTQLYVPMRAGYASFHHPLTLHASDPNTISLRRRAVAVAYEKVN